MPTEKRQHGKTYTPAEISGFLSTWAVDNQDDDVLEPSVGEGRFVFDVYDRLRDLGRSPGQAAVQIHGVDIDTEAIETLQKTAHEQYNETFPNIRAGDIFSTEFPQVDAIVGNPPYVARHNFDDIGAVIDRYKDKYGFSRQSDLYVYVLVRATEFLKPGGKLAVILSNSWLNREYGKEVREFLLNNFYLKGIIGFQEKVFDDLVNSVCVLAEKRENTIQMPAKNEVQFTKIKNKEAVQSGMSIDNVQRSSLRAAEIPQQKLMPDEHWDTFLGTPKAFEKIKTNGQFVPLGSFVDPMIGVQTLHKDFYVLTEADCREHNIEKTYLRPFAYSPSNINKRKVTADECDHYLFWCSDSRSELTDTNALAYIERAENQKIEKRYSDKTYDGLHNKTRIKNASREPWYNVTGEARRRLPADILLPRRVYASYTAVWNPEEVIPNENFIALSVRNETDTKPLLAYLNSSLGELSLRWTGHVYGGGVCDLNVSSASEIQTLDIGHLNTSQRSKLVSAFDRFVKNGNRNNLDNIVYDILGFDRDVRQQIKEALESAINDSTSKNN